MTMTETWRESFNAWWRSRPVCTAVKSPRGFAQMVWQAAFRAAAVTVTTDAEGNAVAVTRTDEDGRVLSVIWERKPLAGREVADGLIDALKADQQRQAKKRAALVAKGKCPECEGEGQMGGQFCGGFWTCEACGGTGAANSTSTQR